MYTKIAFVLIPVLVAVINTVFWMSAWGIFSWRNAMSGLPFFDNRKQWVGASLVKEGAFDREYPVITIRTLAILALGIPTVFFLGALSAMQFIRRPDIYGF